jgi:hypothetical protein
MTPPYGGQAPMNRSATIVVAPTWLVPGLIPDQPGAGSHRFATDCITGGASWDTVNDQHTPTEAGPLWGKRTDNDGTTGDDVRYQFSVKYNFGVEL